MPIPFISSKLGLIPLALLMVIISCSKDSSTPNGESSSCSTFEEIVFDEICEFYTDKTLIVDDPYHGNCYKLLTQVAHIRFSQAKFEFKPSRTFMSDCGGAVGNVASNYSIFEGQTLDDNISIIAQLHGGDYIEMSCQFTRTDCTAYDHCFEFKPYNVNQNFGSPYAECGILGRQWSTLIGGRTPSMWYFLYINNKHILYQQGNPFPKTFQILDDCSEIVVEDDSSGRINKYTIRKVSNDSLIVSEGNNTLRFHRG